MLSTQIIEQVLSTIPQRTIGVLGDLFLDRYLDIDPALDEPSVETGKTAYQVVRVRSYPGAAGTVINNLAALGVGRIYPIAFVGDDGEGYELRQALKKLSAVEHGGIFSFPDRRTPTYTKPMRGTEELNRLDIKNRTPTPSDLQDHILKLLDEAWPRLDALIVLDQVSEEDCGVVTGRVRERLAELGEREPARFVLADSRERIGEFRNVCVKPNMSECVEAVRRFRDYPGSPWNPTTMPGFGAATVLANIIGRDVFCTVGSEGIRLGSNRITQALLGEASESEAESGCGKSYVPAYPVSAPIDIVGAGDSSSAGIACGIVSGLTHYQAAAFGNLVASITIQQIGVTGTATPEQVRARWREVAGA